MTASNHSVTAPSFGNISANLTTLILVRSLRLGPDLPDSEALISPDFVYPLMREIGQKVSGKYIIDILKPSA